MRCDAARPLLSQRFDAPLAGAAAADFDAHVAACGDCAAFAADLARIRRELRYEPLAEVPDLAPAVVAAVDSRPRRRPLRLSAAAVFAAAFVAGAAFVGLDARRPAQVRAEDVPQRVQQAQSHVRSLQAALHVVERGWHPDVGDRRYSGGLVYAAPESLALRLDDETSYPSPAWIPNDVTVVVTPGARWSSGPAVCPREALPSCMAPKPRVQVQDGREPFPAVDPAPLDLIVPVRSFWSAGPPELLGSRQVDGRAAIGAAVTAAQVEPLLEGLRQAGTWREIHPTDRVELWLDEEALVPLAVSVLASDDSDRSLWAARRGYRDPAGAPYLEVTFTDVRLNEPIPSDAFAPPPAGAAARSAGFVAQPAGDALPRPTWLPARMQPYLEGIVSEGGPGIAVAAWTDGRAWVKIRATTGWRGGRLFGDVGRAPRMISLGEAGTAYIDGRGHQIALHAEAVDVVISGTVSEPVLVRIAAGLGVVGQPVPSGWAEGGSATLDQARAALPGLLAPRDAEGFAPPAARISDDVVTLIYSGPGTREFVLAQGAGDRLSPPLGADVRGVAVRGAAGRYTPALSELEWVEDGTVVSLTSQTLGLDELIQIAESLEAR